MCEPEKIVGHGGSAGLKSPSLKRTSARNVILYCIFDCKHIFIEM